MRKSDLIAQLSTDTGLPKQTAEVVVNKVLAIVSNALVHGDSVALSDFGTFTVKSRAARQGRNPRTGESIAISASKSAGFKPAKALKDALNG